MISAVVLAKDEDLRRCLRSLAWAGEVIVIRDAGSMRTDQTIDNRIENGERESGTKGCEQKARVFKRLLNGDFAAQRNFGLEKARGEWVLFVDADEEVGVELAGEINQIIDNSSGIKDRKMENREWETGGVYLRRQDFFMGRWLRFGETGSVKLLRLARRDYGQWRGRVHEEWVRAGDEIIDNRYGIKDRKIENGYGVRELKNPLRHWAHGSMSTFLRKINFYTDLRGRELGEAGGVGRGAKIWVEAVVWPAGKFLQNYFLRRGFLDGMAGLAMVFMMSLHSLIVRVKMYEQGARI